MPLILLLGAGALGVAGGFLAGRGVEGTAQIVKFAVIGGVIFVGARALRIV